MSHHKREEIAGRVKEAAGVMTGDQRLQREGKLDQGRAAVKKTIDDVADKVKDAVDPSEPTG